MDDVANRLDQILENENELDIKSLEKLYSDVITQNAMSILDGGEECGVLKCVEQSLYNAMILTRLGYKDDWILQLKVARGVMETKAD